MATDANRDAELRAIFVAKADRLRVNLNEEIANPQPILTLNGRIVGTLGNISLMLGKPKSGKTTCTKLILASSISNSCITEMFTASLPDNKRRVIYLDTEQDRRTAQRVGKVTLHLAGLDECPHFEVYTLRGESPEERFKFIVNLIRNTDHLGILVIDGIRDLVTSINDESEASKIATMLLNATQQKDIHIMTILHQNKSNQEARGHLGTELLNKAECIFSVSNNGGAANPTFNVVCNYSRAQAFENVSFVMELDGFQRINPNFSILSGDQPRHGRRKRNPANISIAEHQEIRGRLIHRSRETQQLRYRQILDLMKNVVSEMVEEIGDSKCRQYLEYYRGQQWITKHGDEGSPNAYYVIEPIVSSAESIN